MSGQRERPDYALLDATGLPVAFVEAKRLREPLVSHRMQMINYANLAGVPYAGLTDGNQWELYKVFDPAPIEDRFLLNISIADHPAHEVALKLLLLRQPNLASGQPVTANEPEIERPPAPAPEQAPEPPPATPDWVSMSELAASLRWGKRRILITTRQRSDFRTGVPARSGSGDNFRNPWPNGCGQTGFLR